MFPVLTIASSVLRKLTCSLTSNSSIYSSKLLHTSRPGVLVFPPTVGPLLSLVISREISLHLQASGVLCMQGFPTVYSSDPGCLPVS